MPAHFALQLCGFRDGKPNTSDASDAFSVELGLALFEAMGVSPDTPAPRNVDREMSRLLAEDLTSRLPNADPETGLVVSPEKALNEFVQFQHVGMIRNLKPAPSRAVIQAIGRLRRFVDNRIQTPARDVVKRIELFDELDRALASEAEERGRVIEALGEESLLKLDVAGSRRRGDGSPHLELGLSLKWSLRTDRAQDCRSQGAKMAALRRGRMPHFAAVTMEPRPYMLRILGGGSGEVDCVYHLNLPALTEAVRVTTEGRPRRRETAETLRKLVEQRRVRDYDELVAYFRTL